jgi:hypothetical protein
MQCSQMTEMNKHIAHASSSSSSRDTQNASQISFGVFVLRYMHTMGLIIYIHTQRAHKHACLHRLHHIAVFCKSDTFAVALRSFGTRHTI